MLQIVRSILTNAGDREYFFRIIGSIYPEYDCRYTLIEKAYDDAKDAFREKYREDGDRYFEHLRAVTLILILYLRQRNYRLIVAALLHDIVEDIPSWTLKRVEERYDTRIAALVDWMTKPHWISEVKEDVNQHYHARFAQAPRKFFYIKLADRLHNLLTLWHCKEEKIRRKITETKRYYLYYAEKHCILIHELEAIIAELETRLAAQHEKQPQKVQAKKIDKGNTLKH